MVVKPWLCFQTLYTTHNHSLKLNLTELEKLQFVHMDHNFGGVVFAIYLNMETYDA